jgi:putative FmdB family regulatory protein
MPLYDFECGSCGLVQEMIMPAGETPFCPDCDTRMTKIWLKAPPTLTTIVPMFPGCHKSKAGYTHTASADHDATRVQSGYGGCVKPPDAPRQKN